MEAISKILNIKGKVLPFTEDSPTLIAQMKDGTTVVGEDEITNAHKQIDKIKYKDKIKVTPEVIKEVENSDLIIIGIGSLYTSIIPNLLTNEMKRALNKSKAKKMYICNMMSQYGETDGYSASDCIKQINKYVDKHFIDVVLANNKKIPDNILDLYKGEHAEVIPIDKDNIKKMGVEVISTDLLSLENNQAKHDPIKTALAIFTYLTKGDK